MLRKSRLFRGAMGACLVGALFLGGSNRENFSAERSDLSTILGDGYFDVDAMKMVGSKDTFLNKQRKLLRDWFKSFTNVELSELVYSAKTVAKRQYDIVVEGIFSLIGIDDKMGTIRTYDRDNVDFRGDYAERDLFLDHSNKVSQLVPSNGAEIAFLGRIDGGKLDLSNLANFDYNINPIDVRQLKDGTVISVKTNQGNYKVLGIVGWDPLIYLGNNKPARDRYHLTVEEVR